MIVIKDYWFAAVTVTGTRNLNFVVILHSRIRFLFHYIVDQAIFFLSKIEGCGIITPQHVARSRPVLSLHIYEGKKLKITRWRVLVDKSGLSMFFEVIQL